MIDFNPYILDCDYALDRDLFPAAQLTEEDGKISSRELTAVEQNELRVRRVQKLLL